MCRIDIAHCDICKTYLKMYHDIVHDTFCQSMDRLVEGSSQQPAWSSHVSQEAPGIQRHFRSVIIQLQQQCSYVRWDRKCVCLGLLVRKPKNVDTQKCRILNSRGMLLYRDGAFKIPYRICVEID